jgi:hypothetical protein
MIFQDVDSSLHNLRGDYMCDSNNIIINGSNSSPSLVRERNSKIKFETSFVPPADYKFCNKPEEENKKNSFSKTTFSPPPKTVEEAKNKEKRHWRLAP